MSSIETMNEIMMDIIINENTYTLERIFEDEDFNKYRELERMCDLCAKAADYLGGLV